MNVVSYVVDYLSEWVEFYVPFDT